LVLAPEGRLDFYTQSILRNEVEGQVAQGCELMAIDLAAVAFLDSSGIGCLSVCQKKFKSIGGDFCLMNLSDQIEIALNLAGLSQFFPLKKPADLTRAPLGKE